MIIPSLSLDFSWIGCFLLTKKDQLGKMILAYYGKQYPNVRV